MTFLLVPWVEHSIIDLLLGIHLGPNFSVWMDLYFIGPIICEFTSEPFGIIHGIISVISFPVFRLLILVLLLDLVLGQVLVGICEIVVIMLIVWSVYIMLHISTFAASTVLSTASSR